MLGVAGNGPVMIASGSGSWPAERRGNRQRQQPVLAKGNDERLFRDRQDGRLRALGRVGSSSTALRFFHLATVLGLML